MDGKSRLAWFYAKMKRKRELAKSAAKSAEASVGASVEAVDSGGTASFIGSRIPSSDTEVPEATGLPLPTSPCYSTEPVSPCTSAPELSMTIVSSVSAACPIASGSCSSSEDHAAGSAPGVRFAPYAVCPKRNAGISFAAAPGISFSASAACTTAVKSFEPKPPSFEPS